jgi:cytochrome P450
MSLNNVFYSHYFSITFFIHITFQSRFLFTLLYVFLAGYILPKDVTVGIMVHGMHHNPQVYPDPEAFKPERFLPENRAGRHPYAFIPFSGGIRNCIG